MFLLVVVAVDTGVITTEAGERGYRHALTCALKSTVYSVDTRAEERSSSTFTA